ncbi:MAG: hypothetical protein KJ550_03815 [Proteobacteria bacterium]|nr:hypothetical protein [Pseudomonadota bacterium]MBU4068309.1 hypothetical protein [Pseudomonadota bacterium]
MKKALNISFVLFLLVTCACAAKPISIKWNIVDIDNESYDIVSPGDKSCDIITIDSRSNTNKWALDNRLDLSKECESRPVIMELMRLEDQQIRFVLDLRAFKNEDKIWAVEVNLPDFSLKEYLNFQFNEEDRNIVFSINFPGICTHLPEDSEINVEFSLFYLRHYDNINGMGIKKEMRCLQLKKAYFGR